VFLVLRSVEDVPYVDALILQSRWYIFGNEEFSGLHFERRQWGIHFFMIVSTDDVDTNSAPAADTSEGLGSIILEWRF
jgi:hypothetical protein